MRCNAMLFNLELQNSTKKAGSVNHFLTFVDVDTGESFRTWIPSDQVKHYQKFKQFELTLSLTVGEYNGSPQMNCRILSFDVPRDIPSSSSVQLPGVGQVDAATGEVISGVTDSSASTGSVGSSIADKFKR